MYQAVTLGGFLALLLSAAAASWQPATPRIPHLSILGIAAEGACLCWCGLESTRRVQSRTAVRALVVVSALLLGVLPIAWPPGSLDADRPPLMHVVVFGLIATPFAFRPAASIPMGAAVAGTAFLLRQPAMSVLPAAIDAALLALTAWTFGAATHLLLRAVRNVDLVEEVLWRAREETSRATRRAYERERWDALVHDKVLGALTLAARGASPRALDAAAELAGQALLEFHGGERGDSSLGAALRERASLLGLQLTLDLDGDDTDPHVAAAFRDAADEALTNVARHSGQRAATVTGHLSPRSARLVVSDRGVGFHPGAPTTRAGVRLGIGRRVGSVGGTVDVASRPGLGTTVTLLWEAPDPSQHPPTTWDMRTFGPLMAIGTIVLLGHVLMGGYRLGTARHEAVALALGAMLVVNSVLIGVVVPAQSRWLPTLSVVAVAIPGLLTLNLRDAATFDWRYWFVGAHAVVIGAVGLRRSPRAGGALAGGIVLSISLAQLAASGHVSPSVPFAAAPQLLGTAVVAGLFRVALDRSTDATRLATAQASAVRLDRAMQEIKAAEVAARTQAMGRATVRHLVRIAAGHPVAPDEAETLLRAEASIRDQLTARALMSTDVAPAVQDARERGVQVELFADAPLDGPGGSAFVEACVASLRSSPPGARVRAVWRPSVGGRLGTVAVTGIEPGASLGAAGIEMSAAGRLYAEVTADEDAILIEVSEPPAQPCLNAVCRPPVPARGSGRAPARSTRAEGRPG
ncbi:MAG TPA: hypothetical protein VFJ94_11895 [Intrasporangium sp.]|uniref:hypothetical protein n=1 Tax=Intrasporangium sp. TaxID=1925024 RepID=UPI002D794CD1|nr:hypothetical protein [Intrasporangium sp.]HET7399211.1 hypothetical protein [Intrasporangium sp.]